jgi:hypothetical protein
MDTLRGLALGTGAAAPLLGLLFGIDTGPLVTVGIGIAALMMLLSLRPQWQAASWPAAITAIAWALIGLTLGAAQTLPTAYSLFAALAAITGLTHALLRRSTAGPAAALAMAAATLALASQIGMVGPAGYAFGAIVAAGAIAGSLSLRLETIHFVAFGATLLGLFVLSGQSSAAIWFTPAVAWAGALFLGVAAVRVPQLGPRGFGLAAIGVLAPLLALGALHMSRHGVADRYSAAGAFVLLAAALAGVIAVSARRLDGGLTALKLTLWVLAGGCFIALTTGIFLAAPAPGAAAAFALAALAISLLNVRAPDAAWRAFACVSALMAAACAIASGHMLLNEAPAWPAWALVLVGLAGPAALIAVAAAMADRADARVTSGVLEATAFAVAVMAASLTVRLFFSGGALLLQPVGFVEAGAHVAVWLAASLIIASRSAHGSTPVRTGFALLLGLLALSVSGFAAGLWLTPYWSARETTVAPIIYAPLGFLAPAILFWAHWAFWRAQGAEARTRLALAAGALLTAAAIALEAMRWPNAPDWAGALAGASAFALAIIINFAPGVTGVAPRRLHSNENFHRDRRRQQSR